MQELALLPGHASRGTSQLVSVLVAQRGDIRRNPSAEIQKLHHFYHGTHIFLVRFVGREAVECFQEECVVL